MSRESDPGKDEGMNPNEGAVVKRDPILGFILQNKRNVIIGMIFLILIVVSALIRINTFWLPHWKGDQVHYISLAMKLERLGFAHYNLKGLKTRFIDVGGNKKIRLVYPDLTKNPQDKGEVLTALRLVGINYYDQPFFHKPPGLSYVLVLSHKFFRGSPKMDYLVVFTNISKFLKKVKPRIFLESQFWAAIVPFSFSLGLIILTFLFGKILFSERIGFYAAFMIALNPVSIMTSSRILADDMMSFFILLSLMLFYLSLRKAKYWLVFVAGLSAGLAVLSKLPALFVLVIVWIVSVFLQIEKERDNFRTVSIFKILFNKNSIIFAFGAFLISGFWFIKTYKVFGNPFFIPSQADLIQRDMSGWFKSLENRPPGFLLYFIGIPYLFPIFVLSFATFKKFLKEIVNLLKKAQYDIRYIFLWVIILTFYFTHSVRNAAIASATLEHRYMLPVYPAIAVLSGVYLSRLRFYRGRFSQFLGNSFMRECIVVCLFIMCAVWSVPLGIDVVMNEKMLFLAPF